MLAVHPENVRSDVKLLLGSARIEAERVPEVLQGLLERLAWRLWRKD